MMRHATRLYLMVGLGIIAVLANHPGPAHAMAALAIILGLRVLARRADRQADAEDDGGPVGRKAP